MVFKLKKSELLRKANKGFRGYPVGTLAFYGLDNIRASKVVAAVVAYEGAEPNPLERWYSEVDDIRYSNAIHREILKFLSDNGVRSVIAVDGIIGCPHEEGIDYPEGEVCPHCPFWANKDRFTHEIVQ